MVFKLRRRFVTVSRKALIGELLALAREDKENSSEVKVSASASSLVISVQEALGSELTEIRRQNESGVHIQVSKNSLASWHLKALTLVVLMRC